eukprot:UN25239
MVFSGVLFSQAMHRQIVRFFGVSNKRLEVIESHQAKTLKENFKLKLRLNVSVERNCLAISVELEKIHRGVPQTKHAKIVLTRREL